jgi:hypothetical protein
MERCLCDGKQQGVCGHQFVVSYLPCSQYLAPSDCLRLSAVQCALHCKSDLGRCVACGSDGGSCCPSLAVAWHDCRCFSTWCLGKMYQCMICRGTSRVAGLVLSGQEAVLHGWPIDKECLACFAACRLMASSQMQQLL